VGLLGPADEPVDELAAFAVPLGADDLEQALLAEPVPRSCRVGPALDEAVRVEHQREAPGGGEPLRRPRVSVDHAERRPGRDLPPAFGAGGHAGRRRMAGVEQFGARAVRLDDEVERGREDLLARPLGLQEQGEHRQQLLGRGAGEHQRPPGRSEQDAEGGLVGPVPGHVTDDDVQPAVGELDDVEEVSAEQRTVLPGPVPGPDGPVLRGHERGGQQAAFEAGVLPLLQLPLDHPAGRLLDALATHGVGDRAVE
jgi:hypothetical protein